MPMLLSELITHLTNAMSVAGNVMVDGVGSVEHRVEGDVHTVTVWDEPTPAAAEEGPKE